VTVATFLLVLWLPLCVSLLSRDAAVSLTEQRTLAPLPRLELNAASLTGLPAALEAYSDDRMGLRDDLIRAWAWLHIELFGTSSSESLIVGKDGWLFFGDANAVAQHRGLARFDDAALARWGRVLEERRAWLSQRGIAYLLVLVPNKHRVYGEYMPAGLTRVAETSQLDQLVTYLGQHSRVPFLDLREALEAAAARQRIYHKTDTHWNDVGAYAAYRAIVESLGEDVPALAGHPPLAVRPLERTTPGLGLARIVGLSRAYPEHSFDLVVAEPRAGVPKGRRKAWEDRVQRQLPFALGTGDDQLPMAVLFRDSFADALVPFLSESFARIVYVWNRDMDPRVVEVERPQIVIQEIAERFLDRPPRGVEAARTR
jgi:alginate O-acetyltransferase complex protein AlgJ